MRKQDVLRRTLTKHPELFARVPANVWSQEWVVNCLPWGQAEHGVLDYLARYVFRIAITQRRILAMDERTVTFQYKDRKANCQRTCQLDGVEFVRRYLQHILPRGFHKVRYYGLWNPQRRELMGQVRLMLQLQRPAEPLDQQPAQKPPPFLPFAPVCPHCGCDELLHVREIPRPRCRGP
ncbi:MAG: transposase [Planctomycetes bacterium]|nr:transposase [Planctomycetota bacterium]